MAWVIGLGKTGYIKESGRCLAMQAEIKGRPLIIVLLNVRGKLSGFADTNRVRRWLEVADLPAGQQADRSRNPGA